MRAQEPGPAARSGDSLDALVGVRAGIGNPANGRRVVMLVEDDPATAHMYQLGLETAGFEVMVVSDGSELFKALERNTPNVLVLDWELPGLLTGVEIIDNLRLDDRTADLPVIMLSNHLGDIDGAQERALRAGAPWLLKVRTTPVQLAEHVDQVLGRAAGRPDRPPDPLIP